MSSKYDKQPARNLELEALSTRINSFIESYEAQSDTSTELKLPPIFIVGAPRSGTTLMLQYLASTGGFAYPTNLMSRFYASLPFACQVQLMVADKRYDFGGEFSDVDTKVKFESVLGKTQGLTQPSEFWYFWRRFFPLDVPFRLDESKLGTINGEELVAELAAMEELLGHPLLMKAVLMCFHIDFLSALLPNAIFIHVKRDTIHNARSLLNARLAYFGTIDKWYSAKPPEFEWLKNQSPFDQVVGQVVATNREIDRQLDVLPLKNKISVEYASFCEAPLELLKEIETRYTHANHQISFKDEQESRFNHRDKNFEPEWQEELQQALTNIEQSDFR